MSQETQSKIDNPTDTEPVAETTPIEKRGPFWMGFSAQQTFTALKYPNYRLWFYGQMASLVGTWMQSTAQGYLVFQLTQSPAYLGYVGFASGLPSILLMLYGGVISDRVSRRNLMVITQTASMVLAFILAGLTFANLVQPWHIILLALLLGVVNAFDAPARQSFVLEMVEREDLSNAIALNSAMFNSATAVGPAVAGLAYALFGPGWCFTINGVSFIAVIVALLMMKLKPFVAPPRQGSAFTELKAGVSYVVAHPVIRILILIIGMTSVFGMSFQTLVPAWAVDILHGDSTTNGLLQSARGVGALVAALMIASLGRFQFKGKLLTVGAIIFPILLIVFSTIRWLPLSLLFLVGVGWGSMILMNMCNSLVQHHVPDALRGRVMGVYSLTFFGMMPAGSLLAGSLAQQIGSPLTIVVLASCLLVFSGFVWFAAPNVRKLE